MDKRMEQCVQELRKEQDVKGIVCADEQTGIAYHYKGTMSEASAGAISHLAQLCNALEPNTQPTAIILNSSTSKILIKQQGPIVLGIHK